MKIGEIWDFIMRRKTQVFVSIFLFIIIATSVIGSFMPHFLADRFSTADSTEPEITYNNSLILSISSNTGSTAYSLELQNNFQSASVAIYPENLSSEAYIRIFDENNVLVKGEYTAIKEPAEFTEEATGPTEPDKDPTESSEESEPSKELAESIQEPPSEVFYILTEEPRDYTLDLKPGYILELHSGSKNQVQFSSTLDQSIATDFLPSGETERYAVLENGLKKLSWDDTKAAEVLYSQLRRYLTSIITSYQTTIDDETLNHKTADLAQKLQVIHAYQTLQEADQTEFTDFIEHLRRGGSPVITYTGADTYYVDETIDFTNFVTIVDNEDGEIPISNLQITHEINWSELGEYLVELTASDSDHNVTTFSFTITLIDPNDTESPDTPSSPIDPTDPTAPDDPSPSDPDSPDGSDTPPDSSEVPDVTPPAQPSQPLPPNDPSQSLGNFNSAASSSTPVNSDDSSSETEEPETPTLPSGIGTNAPVQPEEESSTPTQVWDNNRPEPVTTSTSPEETPAAGKFSWKTVGLFALGIIFLVFVIKFIFDHYVR